MTPNLRLLSVVLLALAGCGVGTDPEGTEPPADELGSQQQAIQLHFIGYYGGYATYCQVASGADGSCSDAYQTRSTTSPCIVGIVKFTWFRSGYVSSSRNFYATTGWWAGVEDRRSCHN